MNEDVHIQTYLVTGGAGFLGINLIRFLLKKNQKVISLDVEPFNYPDSHVNLKIVQGSILDTETLEGVMQEATRVIHCAAALPLYTPDLIRKTNHTGTRNVLEAAEKLGMERVVHISSTAVYGIPDHHPLVEDDDMHGVGPYGEAKVEAEHECELFREKGMCVPIIRPKSFIGPERLGVFAMLYDWAKDGHGFPVLGDGSTRYQLLDVEDLCQAIWIVATGDCEVVNDTFNIGAEKFESLKEDFQAVLDEAGYGKKIVSLPAGPSIAVLKVLEMFKLSPLYKWVYETAATDSFVSIDKAKDTLGFTPKYSNKDALIRNYNWYIAHTEEFEQRSGVSHRVPWKQGLLGFAKQLF